MARGKWKRENCGECTFPSSLHLICLSRWAVILPPPGHFFPRTSSHAAVPFPSDSDVLACPPAARVRSFPLESLEMEIRFSRQYFFRADRTTATDRPTEGRAVLLNAMLPFVRRLSRLPSLLKRTTAARARAYRVPVSPVLPSPTTSLPVPNSPYFLPRLCRSLAQMFADYNPRSSEARGTRARGWANIIQVRIQHPRSKR